MLLSLDADAGLIPEIVDGIVDVILAPLEEVPMHISDNIYGCFAEWRLQLGR